MFTLKPSQPDRRVALFALLAFLACLFVGCVSMQVDMAQMATSSGHMMPAGDHEGMQDTAKMCSQDQQQCSWKLQPLDLPAPDASFVLLFWVGLLTSAVLLLTRHLRNLLYLCRPEFTERRSHPLSYPRIHRLQSIDLN